MNKCAIITGARRGIGWAVLKNFASHKIKVYACASGTDRHFESEISRIAAEEVVEIIPVYFDLEDETARKKSVRDIVKKEKHIDILVNNAGISSRSTVNMTPIKDLRRAMEINFIAPMEISQIVSKNMIRNKSGVIINVGSVSGEKYAEIGGLSYGSSKVALSYATKVMGKELGGYGIRVNAVLPGFINTDMWKDRSRQMLQTAMERSVLKRMGMPEEIAEIIYFLTTDSASYITATSIVADGGGGMTRYD